MKCQTDWSGKSSDFDFSDLRGSSLVVFWLQFSFSFLILPI